VKVTEEWVFVERGTLINFSEGNGCVGNCRKRDSSNVC